MEVLLIAALLCIAAATKNRSVLRFTLAICSILLLGWAVYEAYLLSTIGVGSLNSIALKGVMLGILGALHSRLKRQPPAQAEEKLELKQLEKTKKWKDDELV